MAVERTSALQILKAESPTHLAMSLRVKGAQPTLRNAMDNRYAGELFDASVQRARVVGMTLAILHRTIGDDPEKRRELDVARTNIIRYLKADPIPALTCDYLRDKEEEIPPFLKVIEDSPLEPFKSSSEVPKIRLDGRPYGYPDAAVLRFLYLASSEYPLSKRIIASLAFPQVLNNKFSSWDAETATDAIITRSLPQLLKSYSKHQIEEKAFGNEIFYYLGEKPSGEAGTTIYVPQVTEREKEKEQITVAFHRDREYVAIGGEKIRLKQSDSPMSQRAQDRLTILQYFTEHQDTWITTSDLLPIFRENDPLTEYAGSTEIDRSNTRLVQRIGVARNWLLTAFSKSGKHIIDSSNSNIFAFRLNSAYALDRQLTDEPFEVSH